MLVEELRDAYNTLKERGSALVESYLASSSPLRLQEIEDIIAATPDFWSKPSSTPLLKEKSAIEGYMTVAHKITTTIGDTDTAWEFYNDGEDEFLADIQNYYQTLKTLVDEFEVKLILSGEYDTNNAIVTLHSGAGGTEADDWCGMLARMYSRWSDRRGFSWEVLDFEMGDSAGYKSVTARIKGEYAYGFMGSEIGVHRLVRISPFDSSSRRHTSFASVSVLPEIDDSQLEVQINPADLRIDTFRASGAGGQHVNTTDSAIRITHLPTGTVVSCQSDRSQHKNKASALKILTAKLFALQQEAQKQAQEDLAGVKSDIAWGSQIRSYVMHPYKMVKDLRTRAEVGNVDAVMDGSIDIFIKEFLLYNWHRK